MKKLAFIFLLATANVANAAFPVGQWTGKFWDAKTGKLVAVDGNCFLADGTWYNTTATGVRGKWFMKGDDVYIHAYSTLGINQVYSSQVQRFNTTLMAGKHQHWAIDGSLAIFATTTLTYVGSTCLPPA